MKRGETVCGFIAFLEVCLCGDVSVFVFDFVAFPKGFLGINICVCVVVFRGSGFLEEFLAFICPTCP